MSNGEKDFLRENYFSPHNVVPSHMGVTTRGHHSHKNKMRVDADLVGGNETPLVRSCRLKAKDFYLVSD